MRLIPNHLQPERFWRRELDVHGCGMVRMSNVVHAWGHAHGRLHLKVWTVDASHFEC